MSTSPGLTIYTTPNCVQCKATIRNLTHTRKLTEGVDFTVIDVSQNPEAEAFVKSLGFTQAPVMTWTDLKGQVHKPWYGFRPDKLGEVAADIASAA